MMLPLLSALLLVSEARSPNVLLIVTDDQRFDLIAALGHPTVHTPHLDRLVKRGFAFRNAYCLGGHMPAVCLPSRNMLLSGRTYFRWIAKGNHAPADPSLPVALKAAGYQTYHHGKKGNVAVVIEKCFDSVNYLADDKERRSGQPGKTVVDGAIRFLDKRDPKKPFFAYLAFECPHDPRVAAEEYLRRYQREKIPLPANFLPQHPFDNGELKVRDEKLAPWPRTPDEIRKHLHEYYAVMTGLDHHLGRLFAELDRRKLTDETLIVFTSDNGLAIGSHGLMGKQNVYDAGLKVPLVFAGPGISHGESTALVYLHDLMPTLLAQVGAQQVPHLDGRDLSPILAGKATKVRDSLFLAYCEVQRAVRDERWKLIRYPKIDRTQLFDLKNDPHETKDVHADHPEQVKRLEALLRTWQKDLGDSVPLSAEPR
ncbi:MAG: sulfatase-like hydrolase/transferase [Gemmataceae bacterium]